MSTAVRLRTEHVTTYRYSEAALQCHNHARLTPRATARQRLISCQLDVSPEAEPTGTFEDYFGNHVYGFQVRRAHTELVITATSVTEVDPLPAFDAAATAPWDQPGELPLREAAQFLYDSPRVKRQPAFARYAGASFAAGRPLLEAALELNRRIHREFKYASGETSVDTPVETALEKRTGVCQDFAHVMLGCFRTLGIPARYVSGYLRSNPKFVGAEASHAWVAVYCHGLGWIDLDPTNNLVPSTDHVTLAWGRDYSDVPPVKGITLGGGEQKIDVGVGVTAA
ncbi:MAG: transglutaminase family protein [Bryobacterales bacterium]|nr:transglutaminase family protein [Bryobacterales bacterium]